MNIISTLNRSINLDGPYKTILKIWARLTKPPVPVDESDGIEFDRAHGTDTCGVFTPDASTVVGPNWKQGQRTQPVRPAVFRDAIDSLVITPADWSFLDFGSGKGRSLILAHEAGFRLILGVEYSRPLCEVADANCYKLGLPEYTHHADASTFTQFGKGPLLLFLFNPFGAPLMAKVAANLAASYARSPRPVIVVYVSPRFPESWHAQKWLRCVRSEAGLAIWRSEA